MALVARELKVVITPVSGSPTTIGGTSTTLLLQGKIRIDKSYPRGTLEFDVVVPAASPFDDATAVTNFLALEAAVRTKHARVQLLSTDRVSNTERTLLDWNPAPGASGNTAFNVEGTVSKPGSPEDTGRSRKYRVTFTADLPADLAGFAGRRDSSVEVEYAPGRRRRLTISGTYTALTTLNATAQYQAQIATYAATIYTALGGTWNANRFLEKFKRDDQDKQLDFTVVYDELIFSEVSGASIFDDPRLVNPTFNLERGDNAPGDTFDKGSVVRLIPLTGSYEAWVDATLSKDLKGIYESTIRPWIIQNAQAFASGGALAVVSESPGIDPVNNKISARISMLAAGKSKILSRSVTTTDDLNLGKILTAIWTGDPWAKTKDQGPMTGVRTINAVQRVLGNFGTNEGPGHGSGAGSGADQFGIFGMFDASAAGLGVSFGSGGGGGGGGAPGDAGAAEGGGDPFKGLTKEIMHQTFSATPLRLGIEPNTIDVTDQVETTVYEFYNPVAAGASTGGGNKVITWGGTGQGDSSAAQQKGPQDNPVGGA